MKKIILISLILFGVTIAFAQAPENFRHQLIVRDASNQQISNTAVALQLSILQGSSLGSPVYRETFSLATNANGLLSLTVGTGTLVSGDLKTIDWSDGPYFIETAIDVDNGTNYTLVNSKEIVSLAYAFFSDTAGFAASADYNSLYNQPTTITQEQIDKIDSISITNSLNLDEQAAMVEVNNAKISFPGFGTTAGTAYDILWTKIGDSAYYDTGKAGIGVPTDSEFSGSKVSIGGGILYDGIPTDNSPGLLFYDTTDAGQFFYYDNLNELKPLGRDVDYKSQYHISGYYKVINSINTLLGIKIDVDAIIHKNLAVGSKASPGYDFNDNNLVLVSDSVRMRFEDTSNSGSFPSVDWDFVINDMEDGGDNYFAIYTVDYARTPFKIMAGAADNSVFVDENGNVGLDMENPSSKLELTGTVKFYNNFGPVATLIGNKAGLTGINYGGSGLLQNTGSTTLNADTDEDSNGAILLQTKNTSRLVVDNSGNVGIGTSTPGSKLDVNGSALIIGNVNLSGQLSAGAIIKDIFYDPAINMIFSTDVTNKNYIFYNSLTTNSFLQSLTSGKQGQKVTLVNTSPAYQLTLVFPYAGPPNIALKTNDSATFEYLNNLWVCTDVVN